jgi:hypothetical protein
MGATAATRDESGRRDCAATVRLCAVSRTQRPVEELVRLVLGPDGTIVPDLARRLPGRGVWVEARRPTLAEAVRRKVFTRSLQQAVTVPDDLPGLVERLMARRLAEAISLANKAGLLVAGFTKVEELIGQGRAAVLIQAADGGADGAAKLARKLEAAVGPEQAADATVAELPGEQLDLAIGRPNVVHAAASGGGAAQRILEEARRLRRYRSGDPQRDSDSNAGRA